MILFANERDANTMTGGWKAEEAEEGIGSQEPLRVLWADILRDGRLDLEIWN